MNRSTDEADREDEEGAFGFAVAGSEAGERIDKVLAGTEEGEGASRSQWQQWIRGGYVTVNGRAVKTNYRLTEGDELRVRIPAPAAADIAPEPIPLRIVFEDEDVVVVNKPRGMVVHPSAGHPGGTLVNALLHHCRDLSGINGEIRPGIVHRIDKDTSGLLMAAKNDAAHAALAVQLKDHSVVRKYIAIVHGEVEHDQGTVDAPLGRDPQDRKLYKVTDKGGRRAVTHFAVMERLNGYTVLELMLETGRTHQIRVHMKFIGYPIVGDPAYGRAKGRTMRVPGQALHAAVLGFAHPRSGKRLLFEAPLPEEMDGLLGQLRML